MSSTRNTKRKRQQQKDEGGGGGSSAAASTSRRRSRDQRAQASSSKTSDPDLEDEASQSVQDSSQDVITTSQTPPTADVSMEDVPGAEVERDPTKQPPQEDYKKTPAKDTKAQSSPTADPPNGTSAHDNLPQNESKSELMTQHARSLRSSPIPVDDAGGNSSQVGTDGQQQQRLPLHISTTLVPEDRETRIQDLIAHRTLLLERVRACRESAEKRLGETKLSSALPRPPAGEKGKEELTDKEEMAAFYDMTKKANQNLKRPKTEGETASDKRTSFSLRRGSGVGKKMNAALSSLAPGSSAAAAAAAAAATVSGSNIEPAIPAASVVNPVPPKTTPSSGGLSPKFGGTTPPPKFPSNQQSAFNPSTTTTDSAFRGRGPGSKAPRTGAGVIPGVHAHPSSFSRPGEADPSTKTTGPGGPLPSAPHLSPNRINQAQSQVPRVFFPEAAALREKRDIIREKLRALLERQHQHQQDHPSPIRRVASREDDGRRSLTASPGRSSAQSPQQHSRIHRRRRVTGVEIQPPTTLPDRRRTHWDTVMQEMSWLAADFIQERQWKVSSARVISSEVPQHHLLKRRPTATLEVESRINDSVINEIDGKRSTTAAKCKQERKGEDVDDEMEDGTDNTVQKKTSKKAPYKKPSLDDETRCKVNGKVVSSMISEVNIAIQKGGASEDADTYHKEGLHRFRKARLECRKAAGISSESDTNSSDTTSEKMVVEGATNGKTSEEEETTLESISERIEQLHKIGKSRHKSTAREYANALMSKHKINLHSNQKSMVDFVEKLWGGEPSAGAVLSGPATSGKTYATATIIWKQRSNGPQIVVCSPQSLFRWKHEMQQFFDIRVVVFGPTGGITSPSLNREIETLESTDVAICDYGSLFELSEKMSKQIPLHSVVVDFRHSMGLYHFSKSVEPGIPPHFVSSKWWGYLMALLERDSTRRLFIEYDGEDPLSLSTTRLESKDQLVLHAKWTACILGLDIFRSKKTPVYRQMLSWARKTGKSEVVDKMERVKKCLRDAVIPLRFHSNEELVSMSDLEWDLRKCPMTPLQRREYERCCYEVRGALSSSLPENTDSSSTVSGTLLAVTSALMRLREHCFHSDLVDVISRFGSRKGTERILGNLETLKQSGHSPSQPDARLAEILLGGSSKLRELASIMLNEAGYSCGSETSIQQVLGKAVNGDDKIEGDVPKKVAIIASLPGIQLMVALFLSAVGIRNALLPGTFWSISSAQSTDEKKLQEISWFQSQIALSSLCASVKGNESERNAFAETTVIVASPSAIGPDAGLGVEGAQMIVVLDTDWSGRDAFILDGLVRRWLARNSLAGKDIELVRVVCDDSLEENLFPKEGFSPQVVACPVARDGCLILPDSDSDARAMYKRALSSDETDKTFPASRIMDERGQLLSDVLGTSAIVPPTLGDGVVAKFLPRGPAGDAELETELLFLREFVKTEILFSRGKLFAGISSSLWKLSQASTESVVLPSAEQRMASTVGARQDLAAIPTFLFLERLARSQSTIKLLGGDVAPILLSQLTKSSMMDHNSNEGPDRILGNDNPSSVLLYERCSSTASEASRSASIEDGLHKRRFNSYAKVFSSDGHGISLLDGNQGNEALVFFPPLFPLLQDSAKRAKHDHYYRLSSVAREATQASLLRGAIDSSDQPLSSSKRKADDVLQKGTDELHVDKRPKIEAQATPANGIRNVVETSKVTPPQLNSNGDHTSAEGSRPRHPLSPVEEDFGLLGSGAVARKVDSASFSSYDSVRIGGYNPSTDKFDFLTYPLACDAEETKESALPDPEHNMGDVLLFVKKKPRGFAEPSMAFHGRQPPLHLPFRNHDIPSSGSQLPSGISINGEDFAKRAKKRSPAQTVAAASTRVTGAPVGLPSPIAYARKDFRKTALASYQGREKSTGLSMFDSYFYRMAATRIERRVSRNLDHWIWKSTMTYDDGPGIPTDLNYEAASHATGQRSWVNIAEKLSPESATGDLARSISRTQRSLLRRSLVSPCRVDFGPFEAGFFASPSGMTSISSPRVRVGVSLPMGVKVAQPQPQEGRSSTSWSAIDEKLLRDNVLKYGNNWLLVACASSGVELEGYNFADDRVSASRSVSKSSIECRDKWGEMTRSKPDLTKEVDNAQMWFENGNSDPMQGHGSEVKCHRGLSVIMKSAFLKKSSEETADTNKNELVSKIGDEKTQGSSRFNSNSIEDEEMPEETSEARAVVSSLEESKPRRRFLAAVSLAKTRKHVVPITIPGVVSGQPPNQPVPSHPSHIQAVQTSVTAQWAQGRTEMWPLQILDLADKQRHAARAASLQRATNGSSPSARRPQHVPGIPASHRGPPSRAPSGRHHHGHGPYPAVPANAPVNVVASIRPGGPSKSSVGSPPQHIHPHHHSHPHPHHRSPPVATTTAQAYVPPPSAPAVARAPSANTSSSKNNNSEKTKPKPAPAAKQPSAAPIVPSPAPPPAPSAQDPSPPRAPSLHEPSPIALSKPETSAKSS